MVTPRFIGDVGATYTRFAIESEGRVDKLHVFETSRFPSLHSAIENYLNDPDLRDIQRPVEAGLAIAGPVSGDVITLMNKDWTFSKKNLEDDLSIEIRIYNDFAAVARAMPVLKENDRVQVGGQEDVAEAPIAIIGPGTGLGIAGLVRTNDDWLEIPGEGGHMTMPAITREEAQIIDILRLRWDHVSAERVLSGDGLVNLYRGLCTLHGGQAPNFTRPAEITTAAIPASDQVQPNWLCVRAFELFCAMLGTIAGDVALMFGAARVYVSGGILQRFPKQFTASAFRARFEQKGRLSNYLKPIPTYLVLHQAPALLGLIELMRSR